MLASVCSLITNITRQLHTKKGHKVEFTTPDDFMMKWGDIAEEVEPKKQSLEDMQQVLGQIAGTMGNKDKIEKK